MDGYLARSRHLLFLCYNHFMANDDIISTDISPKAVMTADELRRWRALTSAEQRRRFEEAILEAAGTPRVEPDTPEQIFARVESKLRDG